MTMKFWTARAALFALAAAITAPAVGGTLPPIMLVTKLGYLEARPDMFKSPYDATRQQSPNGFYAASGDFDGDGKADEARLLIDRAGKNAVLVIVIDHGPNIKTYGFDKMKATQLGSLGIKVAPPGTYRLANPAGGVTTKTIGTPAVMMFRYGGAARLYTFAKDDFIATDILVDWPAPAQATPAQKG